MGKEEWGTSREAPSLSEKERKVKCGSGGCVASFQAPWLRRSPRNVDGASRPCSGMEKPQRDAQDSGLRRNSYGKPLLGSVLIP
jgi:hypothetical protein